MYIALEIVISVISLKSKRVLGGLSALIWNFYATSKILMKILPSDAQASILTDKKGKCITCMPTGSLLLTIFITKTEMKPTRGIMSRDLTKDMQSEGHYL